ncbi:MAG: cytochrome c biogenesis protein [Phycisphaeraceae bacterium]
MTRLFPWLVLLIGAAILARPMMPTTHEGPYDLAALKRLPVSADGRVKPLDTVARMNLLAFSGRQTLQRGEEKLPAIRWLIDVMAGVEGVHDDEVFRIDHPGVLALLDQAASDRKRFSFNELAAHGQELVDQARRANDVQARRRNPFQRAVLELYGRVDHYQRLARHQAPYLVPPRHADETWQQLPDVAQAAPDHPAAQAYPQMFRTYRQGEPEPFNAALTEYRDALDSLVPGDVRRGGFEVFFNRFQPFYYASILYVFAFLLACGSWLGWSAPQRRGAVALVVLILLVHTFGIAARIYLQGRPPVTNLYSSAVFIGWGCVLIGLFLEYVRRDATGVVCAAVIGFLTLLVAHHLGGDGDTMQMMQAVLDTNFWLATHVTAITIGYSATFFAGLLGILFIILGIFTPRLRKAERRSLGQAIYGVVCFALLFSFVGTVLGGIWADVSWGRFWGWDPKENGAALIVLMNALILHARWGGMIQQRGMAVLAVGGNIITSWSWFGTNMLGVGLHSYGFMDSAMFWLFAFVVSQLAIMGIGLLPQRMWLSVQADETASRARDESAVPGGKPRTA